MHGSGKVLIAGETLRKEATGVRLTQPARSCSNVYPSQSLPTGVPKETRANTYGTNQQRSQDLYYNFNKAGCCFFFCTNGVLLTSIMVSGSWPISILGHRSWKWPRSVSDNHKKTTAQRNKLDRFVARHRRLFSWNGLPPSSDIAEGPLVGETQHRVLSDRRFRSEPQPANGGSLCLHHQTIKVLYTDDHQEGR